MNGKAAGSAPGPNVPAGSPVTITVPVTNNGSIPVSGLGGRTSLGTLNCGSSQLAPGSTARCTVTTTARPGSNAGQFNFTVSGPNGTQQSKACRIYYTGTPTGTGTSTGTGTPTGTGKPAGTGKLAITGTPTVNGVAVGPNSTANVPLGRTSTAKFQVTNTGSAPISNLRGSSPNGQATCADTTLAPGASTSCTMQFHAGPGTQIARAAFTGKDTAGGTSTVGFSQNYTTTGACTCDPAASTATAPTAVTLPLHTGTR